MPATLMGLLGQYIIQPSLTKITEYIKDKNYADLRKIIINLIKIIFGLGTIITIIAYFLELPVLKLIYGIELEPYFTSMIIIVVGSIFYSLSTILSAILIAMRKTSFQATMYFITAIISTILAYSLVKESQIFGASITYFITMLIISSVFLIYVIFNMKEYKNEWSN